LLEDGRETGAGVTLAWLTIKPQLTAVLLLAVLLRLLRQRRWKAVASFLLTLAVLAGVSTFVVPSWPVEMLQAPGRTAAPTEHYPGAGSAWLRVLTRGGGGGWWVGAPSRPAPLPFLGAVVGGALPPSFSCLVLMAVRLLAVFFVPPSARHYDFPVLLI